MNGISVGGLIGDKWRALGAERGPLGPPSTNDEESVPGRNGRKRRFWYGEISWSPDQGPNMVVAGWKATSTSGSQYIVTATLDWGTTSPFNYDFFIVRWDRNGANIGQQDIRGGPRDHGRFSTQLPNSGGPNLPPSGDFSFEVEGCDGSTFGGATCRQGWAIPVNLTVTRGIDYP